ncbi:SDR family oxidoreductase [Sphingomonas piscis]|uniref:SDR family oxidoreductase n=2 Tax=Sphingomonas piscis TaxID=2714943 RepID=A0A6G7YTI6_9SPHN|nr:SDR family oxidoreductase [Sphingomonas piscis]
MQASRSKWLVTGAAGFIGSNLVESLLKLGQQVVALDNFATGHRANLRGVEEAVGADLWANFKLVEGDIRDRETCDHAVSGVDYVLHQAALGSVPRSIEDPLTANEVNVTGFLNVLEAGRRAAVKRVVYAASSATYGDETTLPASEERIGNPLSPYAATKLINEVYAGVYARTYDLKIVGLRYFNVFGPRQDPAGAYAAVIPRWVAAMIKNEEVVINGDGSTTRDFCYVADVVQANLRAALADDIACAEVYNVAVGQSTSLNKLYELIKGSLQDHDIAYEKEPSYAPFQMGDVRHSRADISKAKDRLGYSPQYVLSSGIAEALPWYIRSFEKHHA